MFRVLLSLFVSFFVHFQKLIRPHAGPLWGGVQHKVSRYIFFEFQCFTLVLNPKLCIKRKKNISEEGWSPFCIGTLFVKKRSPLKF